MHIKSELAAAKYLSAQIWAIREALDAVSALAGNDCQAEIKAMLKAINKADALVERLNFLE